jgi:hypothetical protein
LMVIRDLLLAQVLLRKLCWFHVLVKLCCLNKQIKCNPTKVLEINLKEILFFCWIDWMVESINYYFILKTFVVGQYSTFNNLVVWINFKDNYCYSPHLRLFTMFHFHEHHLYFLLTLLIEALIYYGFIHVVIIIIIMNPYYYCDLVRLSPVVYP